MHNGGNTACKVIIKWLFYKLLSIINNFDTITVQLLDNYQIKLFINTVTD